METSEGRGDDERQSIACSTAVSLSNHNPVMTAGQGLSRTTDASCGQQTIGSAALNRLPS
jgi:hypothetical protein